jgi:hypothetical protein
MLSSPKLQRTAVLFVASDLIPPRENTIRAGMWRHSAGTGRKRKSNREDAEDARKPYQSDCHSRNLGA